MRVHTSGLAFSKKKQKCTGQPTIASYLIANVTRYITKHERKKKKTS